jgi:hypothetical protein
MMGSSSQAASVQRRFLCCDYEWRKKAGIDGREREMGSKPAHTFPQILAGLQSAVAIRR